MKSKFIFPLLFLSSVQLGGAAVTFGFNDTVGDPTSVTINPGATFVVSLSFVSTAELSYILEYKLLAQGAGSGQFTIVGRDVTGTAFEALANNNMTVLLGTNAALDPNNENDLGGTSTTGPIGIGNHQVATFTIQAASTVTDGSYSITTAALLLFDDSFMEVSGISNPTYTINVVPEPSMALLACAGLGFPLLFGRRRFPRETGR